MAFDFDKKENQQLNNIRAGLIDFVSGSLGNIIHSKCVITFISPF